MIDLYSRIGLSPSASQEAIRANLDKVTSSSDREAIQHILLNPMRRKVYDKHWVTLMNIGRIRANLRMGGHDNDTWSRVDNKDFVSIRDNYPPLLSQLQKMMSTSTSSTESYTGNASIKDTSSFPYGARILMALIVFGVAILLYNPTTRSNYGTTAPSISSEKETNNARAIKPEPVFNEPALPLPETSIISRSYGEAPFEIVTGTGAHYFIKLCTLDGESILEAFVRGGNSLETTVPLGTYVLKYAVGEVWYGREHLFGPETTYHKARQNFSFRLVGNQYSGYTVELIKQTGGNLSTHRTSKEDF